MRTYQPHELRASWREDGRLRKVNQLGVCHSIAMLARKQRKDRHGPGDRPSVDHADSVVNVHQVLGDAACLHKTNLSIQLTLIFVPSLSWRMIAFVRQKQARKKLR